MQSFDGIKITYDDQEIEGIIGEKQKIDRIFKEKDKKGETVVKTEPLNTTSLGHVFDLLETKIGNIPPKKNIKICFSFIQLIDTSMNKKYRLCFPFTLTPRYIPNDKTLNLLADMIYVQNLTNDCKDSKILKKSNIKHLML